jgi:hypothetical protein
MFYQTLFSPGQLDAWMDLHGNVSVVERLGQESFQAILEIVPQVAHDHFLSSIFKFIIHLSSYHTALHNLDMESSVM